MARARRSVFSLAPSFSSSRSVSPPPSRKTVTISVYLSVMTRTYSNSRERFGRPISRSSLTAESEHVSGSLPRWACCRATRQSSSWRETRDARPTGGQLGFTPISRQLMRPRQTGQSTKMSRSIITCIILLPIAHPCLHQIIPWKKHNISPCLDLSLLGPESRPRSGWPSRRRLRPTILR